ncbi:MAG: hypothetical protein ACTSV7_14900 [Candidatus Baldrarchaeia archaeon]
MRKKPFPIITLLGFILLLFGVYTYFNSSLLVSYFGSFVGAVQYNEINKDEIKNNIYVPLYGSVVCEAGAVEKEKNPIYVKRIFGPTGTKGVQWAEKTFTFSKIPWAKYEDFHVRCFGAKNTAGVWGLTVEIWKNGIFVDREHKFYFKDEVGREGEKSCSPFPIFNPCTEKDFDFEATLRIPVEVISSDRLKIKVACYQSGLTRYASRGALGDALFNMIKNRGDTEALDVFLESQVSNVETKGWVIYNHEGVKQPSPANVSGCPTSTVRQIVRLEDQPAKGEERELPKKQSVWGIITGWANLPPKDFYDPDKYERFYYAPVGDGFIFVEDWKKLEAPDLVVLNYKGEAVIGRRTIYGNEIWEIDKVELSSGKSYYIPVRKKGTVTCLDNSDCKGDFYCSEEFECERTEGRCLTDFDCSHGRGMQQYVWNGVNWDLVDYSGSCQNGVCQEPRVIATNLKCNPTMPNACGLGYHCDPTKGCVPDNTKLYCQDNECCFGSGYLNPHDCPPGYKCYRAFDSDRGICVPEDDPVDKFCDFDGQIDKGENCENCAHDIEAKLGEGFCKRPSPRGKYELIGLTLGVIGFVMLLVGLWREF